MAAERPPIPELAKKSIDGTKVSYKRLGNSGLRVSVPILGAMSFGEHSERLLKSATF